MGRGDHKLTFSFDLDGTLTTTSFADSIWLEGLPRLLADRKGMSFDSARQMCTEGYERVGDDSLLWYDLPYWLKHYGLEGVDPERFIAGFHSRLELFDDVLPVLGSLKGQGHELILFSNAARPFLNAEVSLGGLEPFFSSLISVSGDWCMVKSDPAAFRRLREMAGPGLIHVGDHVKFDYEVPRSVGIPSFLVARTPQPPREDTLDSLYQLMDLDLSGRTKPTCFNN